MKHTHTQATSRKRCGQRKRHPNEHRGSFRSFVRSFGQRDRGHVVLAARGKVLRFNILCFFCKQALFCWSWLLVPLSYGGLRTSDGQRDLFCKPLKSFPPQPLRSAPVLLWACFLFNPSNATSFRIARMDEFVWNVRAPFLGFSHKGTEKGKERVSILWLLAHTHTFAYGILVAYSFR